MKNKKIALIGNMNNNNFSIMRYFRDLGFDAHLLLFKNDGVGSNSHFFPENDTWEYEKWKPYIHQLDFNIDPASVQEKSLFSWILYSILRIRLTFRKGKCHDLYKPVPKHKIKNSLKGYNVFIGSGLTGAMLMRVGLKMDIFYPFSMGIEYLGTILIRRGLKHNHPIKRYLTKSLAKTQKSAITNATICVNGEMSLTKQTFEEIGVRFLPINIPMVYNREILKKSYFLNDKIVEVIKDMESCDFSILTHSRQLWIRKGDYSAQQWESYSKHSDWLFKGMAGLLSRRPMLNCKLFALEYGEDVVASKKLCTDLGLEKHVVWLPQMSRKELMLLLRYCHIGVGEFYTDSDVMWGGTGWEVLAMGKPLLQGFNFDLGQFEHNFGHPPPPMLPVKHEDDILSHLIDISDNPQKGKEIGVGALEWFNTNGGIGLAKKWLSLLK